jgi:hypothetical protein
VISDAERMDIFAQRAVTELGAQSLGCVHVTPADEAMRREEGGADVWGERAEVLSRVMIYVMGGSFDPRVHGERLAALSRAFGFTRDRWDADLLRLGPEVRVWEEPEVWQAQGMGEGSWRVAMRELVSDEEGPVVVRVVRWFFREGERLDRAVKAVWALALAMRPELLPKQTCQGVADVFCETRAAVSARVKRVYSKPIEEQGGCGHAYFQKSAGAVASYRAAQRGNQNRMGTGRREG